MQTGWRVVKLKHNTGEKQVDKKEAKKRIKEALKRQTGKSWSVTSPPSRFSTNGYLLVQAPPKRRVSWDEIAQADYDRLYNERGRLMEMDADGKCYTSADECSELAQAFGLETVDCVGLLISLGQREEFVAAVEAA
jgi:hypothetical protein